jgi:hypothetical protein
MEEHLYERESKASCLLIEYNDFQERRNMLENTCERKWDTR